MSAADGASALEQLGRDVQKCQRCDLYREASHGVPGEGPVDAAIMLSKGFRQKDVHEAAGSSVVYLSSVTAYRSKPALAAYAATKGALKSAGGSDRIDRFLEHGEGTVTFATAAHSSRLASSLGVTE